MSWFPDDLGEFEDPVADAMTRSRAKGTLQGGWEFEELEEEEEAPVVIEVKDGSTNDTGNVSRE